MDRFPIIAVASSAGDLGVVAELLAALPAAGGAAVAIVQHLDPARRDLPLEHALANRTDLPVLVAHDGVVPKRGHVYVLRANSTLTINGGRMRVSPRASGHSDPGNTLFTSLAAELSSSAIGIVLSGTGCDGAIGTRAIKQLGGTTFAQYPGSARFPGMPLSAIETGCVDFVLRPNEIARELSRLDACRAHIALHVPPIRVSVTD